MPADPAARRLHLWTGLVLLGTFLAGAAAGAGVSRALGPPRHLGGPGAGPGPEGRPPFPRELELTAAQEAQARAIFERHRPAIDAVIRETFPRVRAAQEEMERELRTILTPAQARTLDELAARRPPLPPGGPGAPGGPGGGFHGFGPGGPPREGPRSGPGDAPPGGPAPR